MNRWLLGLLCLLLGAIVAIAGTKWWTTTRQSANEPSQRATDALRAVASLKSTVSVGVTYPEYLRRLAEAKIKFDEGVDDLRRASSPAALSMTRAFDFYKLAATIWKIKNESTYETKVVMDTKPLLNSTPCLQFNALTEQSRAAIYDGALETALACGNAYLTEAEKLLREKK